MITLYYILLILVVMITNIMRIEDLYKEGRTSKRPSFSLELFPGLLFMIGFVSSQWLIFILLFIITFISKTEKYSGIFLCSINILLTLFIVINRYHLHINILDLLR